MIDIGDMMCCGIGELSGISDTLPEQVFEQIYEEIPYDKYQAGTGYRAAFIFTQAYARRGIKAGYGDKLAAQIKKHRFGEVETIDLGKNPNSNNYVRMFVWKVDWKRLIAYGKKQNWSIPDSW